MTLRTAVDTALDRSLVLGYSRIGYATRKRHWVTIPANALVGKTVAITGANAGLGKATAIGAARLGADVRMLCRDEARAEAARSDVAAAASSGSVVIDRCDLSSLDSVRTAAQRIVDEVGALHGLVHNAGIFPAERTESVDGHEIALATHVLGPHLLTRLLQPALSADGDARVVFVSSGGQYAQPIDIDDLEYRTGEFKGSVAYARTKRMQVVLAGLWGDEVRGSGVSVHAMHPGWAATPGVTSSLPKFEKIMRPLLRTADQGVDTTLWLLVSTEAPAHDGAFWHDRRPRPTDYLSRTAVSADDARALWEFCEGAVDE